MMEDKQRMFKTFYKSGATSAREVPTPGGAAGAATFSWSEDEDDFDDDDEEEEGDGSEVYGRAAG